MTSGNESAESEAAMDPTLVAADAADIHADLLEVEDAFREGHEARGALLLRDVIEDMSGLTGDIKKL